MKGQFPTKLPLFAGINLSRNGRQLFSTVVSKDEIICEVWKRKKPAKQASYLKVQKVQEL